MNPHPGEVSGLVPWVFHEDNMDGLQKQSRLYGHVKKVSCVIFQICP